MKMKDSLKTSCSWMKRHFTHLVSCIFIVREFAKIKMDMGQQACQRQFPFTVQENCYISYWSPSGSVSKRNICCYMARQEWSFSIAPRLPRLAALNYLYVGNGQVWSMHIENRHCRRAARAYEGIILELYTWHAMKHGETGIPFGYMQNHVSPMLSCLKMYQITERCCTHKLPVCCCMG
jgi:hypothetical protein